MWYVLYGCGVSVDDVDVFVGKFGQIVVCIVVGVVVILVVGVKVVVFEGFDVGNVWQFGMVQWIVCQNDEMCGDVVFVIGFDQLVCFVVLLLYL